MKGDSSNTIGKKVFEAETSPTIEQTHSEKKEEIHTLVKDALPDQASINKVPDESTAAEPIVDSLTPTPGNELNVPAGKKFLIGGTAFAKVNLRSKMDSAGFELGWLPIFLWRPGNRLFFEAHLHIDAGGHSHGAATTAPAATTTAAAATPAGGHTHGATASSGTETAASSGVNIMLNYANLVYFLNPYMAITGGIFLSPFGIYGERLHADWINKLPDAPVGMGHNDQMIPLTEFGVQVRGGVPVRKFKFNYAVYISNGPQLVESGTTAGQLSYASFTDNNTNKAIGGRAGLFPVPGSNFELGVFAQKAGVGTDYSRFSGVDALLSGADISFNHYFGWMKGTLDIKGQYSKTSVDKVYYSAAPLLTVNVPAEDVNLADSTYRFNNVTKIYFITVSYRPTASMKFLKNLEYSVRYDAMETPAFALWSMNKTRWTGGIIYWFEARSALKLAFQSGRTPMPYGQKDLVGNLISIQFVIGL